MTKILAWKNDPKLKAFFISRLEEHARLDQLVQGIGFEPERRERCLEEICRGVCETL